MRQPFALLGVVSMAAAVLIYERARRIAEQEGRPLSEVLAEMPSRLVRDLGTIADDLREATDEGREAAAQREQEIDEELAQARDGAADVADAESTAAEPEQ